MTRLQKAHVTYLNLRAAYDVLVKRGASLELRAELLDAVSDAHRTYHHILIGTMAAAAAGTIPERRTA